MAYLAAALGGALGALARWAVGEWLPHRPGQWPWSTLVVNLVGCAAIGLLLAVLLARYADSPWLRPFLAVGVLGGFTTYSTFAVDAAQLVDAGRPLPAAGYVLLSVLGGLLAVVAGLYAGRAAVGRAEPRAAAPDRSR